MPLSWNEIKDRAAAFSNEWKVASNEDRNELTELKKIESLW